MTNYEEKHPYKKFLTELNNILQNIHTLALGILQEYDMISAQYTSKTIDETKLHFSIGNVRIINIEPYKILLMKRLTLQDTQPILMYYI